MALDPTIEKLKQAAALRPNDAGILTSLAMALIDAGKIDEAIDRFRQVVILCPSEPAAHSNLASAMGMTGRTLEVIPILRRAIELRPDYAPGHHNLGNALKDCGDIAVAIACYDRAIELEPHHAPAQSNRLFALHFHPAYDETALDFEHRNWAGKFASGLSKLPFHHPNDRNPDRRLRIGYVSADFREHVVGWNLRPLFRERDRAQFEVYCYCDVHNADSVTVELRSRADVWRDVAALTDAQLADLIRRDAIDVLVDLSAHTDGNRLLAFAARPAPVQMTYLGYCGTTGLAAMDYRISDPYLDTPGADPPYIEKTLHLGKTYWCYQPGGDAPEPGSPPAIHNGCITFGCLNNFAKVSDDALKLWAELLGDMPTARLMLHAPAGPRHSIVTERIARAGLPLNQVICIPRKSWREYINLYHQIDIALDPFPFGGGITTCDALWMGVPVVTLRGNTAVGRGGMSILSNLGMPELIALGKPAYLRIARELAGDFIHLAHLRRTLRDRLAASSLMDANYFARDLESLYRRAWHGWIREPAR